MPRPKPHRELVSEQNVAKRVAYEREQRGWSYAGLALRMEKVGCKIDQSALYKIEKANPPRRITVDELVGFGAVFGLSLVELTTPMELVITARLEKLLAKFRDSFTAMDSAVSELGAYINKHMSSEAGMELLYQQRLTRHPDFQLYSELVSRMASKPADAT